MWDGVYLLGSFYRCTNNREFAEHDLEIKDYYIGDINQHTKWNFSGQ